MIIIINKNLRIVTRTMGIYITIIKEFRWTEKDKWVKYGTNLQIKKEHLRKIAKDL